MVLKSIGLLNTITLPNLVSSATALLIQHTLEHTKHIRVGSGGIMLFNHAPLIVGDNSARWQHYFQMVFE